jgi:hypothetical protein
MLVFVLPEWGEMLAWKRPFGAPTLVWNFAIF